MTKLNAFSFHSGLNFIWMCSRHVTVLPRYVAKKKQTKKISEWEIVALHIKPRQHIGSSVSNCCIFDREMLMRIESQVWKENLLMNSVEVLNFIIHMRNYVKLRIISRLAPNNIWSSNYFINCLILSTNIRICIN
jgi:hypothetical protein